MHVTVTPWISFCMRLLYDSVAIICMHDVLKDKHPFGCATDPVWFWILVSSNTFIKFNGLDAPSIDLLFYNLVMQCMNQNALLS